LDIVFLPLLTAERHHLSTIHEIEKEAIQKVDFLIKAEKDENLGTLSQTLSSPEGSRSVMRQTGEKRIYALWM
jgi:hypothetical protein